MLIGNRYADNKLYRGIKHYDSLPLTSGDLHEYADILQMKNAFFMNNIIGSGTLNEPTCVISSGGISLDSPSIVLVDGDISLIQSDNTNFVSLSQISQANHTEGLVCIVGWYQSLTSSSTLRAYGGVNNSVLENDIKDIGLNIQVSTRYQLRWDIVLLDEARYNEGTALNFSLPIRDETGALASGNHTIRLAASEDNVRIATKPTAMTYAVSDLYVVPILKYTYTGTRVSKASAYRAVRPIGSSSFNFLKSTTEPVETDSEIPEGSIWYNPETYKFKFYVEGTGFVPTASDLVLMQYNSTITVSSATSTPSSIRVPIGISSFTNKDILQVLYNGAVLTQGEHYTIDYTNVEIVLQNATTEIGDAITFIVIRLVDSSSLSSIANEFRSHVALQGNSVEKGHVTLSDSANASQGIERGIAVTPKALYNATILTDTATSKKYKLTITNGVLGITQVQ